MAPPRVVVYHGGYGCETGCCGHWIELYDDGDSQLCYHKFEWGHSESNDDAAKKTFALGVAQDFVRRYHPKCYDTIDWNTLEYEDVQTNDYC